MTNRFTPTLVICLVSAAAAVAALGLPASPEPSPVPASGDSATSVVVEIVDFQFSNPTDVTAGATVEVVNSDGVAHTVTAVDGTFDSGVVAGSGVGAIVAPPNPGSYEYFCAIHPSMTGSLTVSGN